MVDPANTPLGKMLLEEISPVVMVLPTPLVEDACRKNGLSLVQMLSPFCVFNNIDVPVRTASDQPYRIQKFKLRLFYASDIRQLNLEVAEERLKHVITEASAKDISELSSDPPPIEKLLTSSGPEIIPSWFQIFNEELIRTLSFSDHEAFDHPVACLLVVSSKDEDPVNRFVDLFNTNQLPSLLNDGVMDPKILKHYLLVHDNQDGVPENANKILTEMKNTFGFSDCRLLCINSSKDGLVGHLDNPWAPYKTGGSAVQYAGCFLNIDDVDAIKEIMQDLSSKHIIPYMEQKLRALNQQVSATRRGFRNQIKNLWWRKGKEDAVDNPNGSVYTFSSTESQIRVLGDYAFMLRDYELALSNYRLISTDYKLDKAWKHYAGVQEMIGLTYFLLDQSRKDAEHCMENAFTTYLKMGLSGRQNAIRCGLWWVEMLKTWDQHKEAANVYFRISGEDPHYSAVMLEQASYCYLFCRPSMLHKYGFHLVLAGDYYRKCDQIEHAIRTYKSAISVYKGTPWSHIKDHVHFHVGKWYAVIGLFDVAVTHMMEVLACTHQSKTTQEFFLKDFLQIVEKTGRRFEAYKLQLPVVDMSSLKVLFEDHRTYASLAAVSVKETLWHSLEEDMIPSLPIAKTNWLELQSKLIPQKYSELSKCVAGEAIKVDIEFRNPLQVSLSVTSVSLLCELSTKADKLKSDPCISHLQSDSDQMTASREQNSGISSFSLSEVDLSLGGSETTVVQLTVTPKVEGVLNVIGVKWKLSDSVAGFYKFESTHFKRKTDKGRGKDKLCGSRSLDFVVIKALPKLEGWIPSIPKKVYAGDLRRLVLELKNQSVFPVKNLKMKISHPRFLHVGNDDHLKIDFPACLEKKAHTAQIFTKGDPNRAFCSVFSFPEDVVIQGKVPFLLPFWFRAAAPGIISMYITIYYETGDVSDIMKYRILRMHFKLQVLPSLDLSFQISPVPLRLREFLVCMDVVNRTISESFQLHQLSCIGHQWEISLLEPIDRFFPSQYLMAGQALSCFFKLKRCRKLLPPEDVDISNLALMGSDIRLFPLDCNKPLFDISSSPLTDFHHHERTHQGALHPGHGNAVDFILITRLPTNDINSASPEHPQLFSHHACHCSTESTSPIWWVLEGPRTLHHDFSASFIEIKLRMTVHNSSDAIASIRINTFDAPAGSAQPCSTTALPSENQAGWRDVSLEDDTKAASDALETRRGSMESAPPFVWCGSSAPRVKIDPVSTVEIPLQVCVFSPGTFDLSNYILHWELLATNDRGADGIERYGTCEGLPYYLTVLHSALLEEDGSSLLEFCTKS